MAVAGRAVGALFYALEQTAAYKQQLVRSAAISRMGSLVDLSGYPTQSRRDRRGRSLRACDLQTRLFKYPCSFLIHSDAFDALPTVMRDHLYKRLWDILHGRDANSQFAKLRAPDRQAMCEILGETKSALPDYWRG